MKIVHVNVVTSWKTTSGSTRSVGVLFFWQWKHSPKAEPADIIFF